MFEGAFDVHEFRDEATASIETHFKLKTQFPAENVVGYYGEYFKNWERMDEMSDKGWGGFVDETISGKPNVIQYMRSWTNKKEKKEATVNLRYYSLGKSVNKEELYVVVKVWRF